MILKLNERYDVPGGYIVPRSHFERDAGANYAIFQITRFEDDRFKTWHATLTKKEIKKLFPIEKGEKIEII